MGIVRFLGVVVAGAAAILATTRLISRRREGPVVPIVRIATYDDLQSADLARRALTAAGVWSHPRGGHYLPTRSAFVGDVGTWEIWVREKDAERARAFLGIN